MPLIPQKNSSGGARRGPPKAHTPYRGENYKIGRRTGIIVHNVTLDSDGFEPFEKLLQYADGQAPPRLKMKKHEFDMMGSHDDGCGEENEESAYVGSDGFDSFEDLIQHGAGSSSQSQQGQEITYIIDCYDYDADDDDDDDGQRQHIDIGSDTSSSDGFEDFLQNADGKSLPLLKIENNLDIMGRNDDNYDEEDARVDVVSDSSDSFETSEELLERAKGRTPPQSQLEEERQIDKIGRLNQDYDGEDGKQPMQLESEPS